MGSRRIRKLPQAQRLWRVCVYGGGGGGGGSGGNQDILGSKNNTKEVLEVRQQPTSEENGPVHLERRETGT